MKHLYCLLCAIVLLSACQSKNDTKITTRSSEGDEPVTFFADTNFYAFSQMTFEDRLAASNIPIDVVKELSTLSIVKSILKYPLNFVIFAYDNPYYALRIIIDNSNLHQELARRNDAAMVMAGILSQTKISWETGIEGVGRDFRTMTIPLSDELFFEIFISTGYIEGFDVPEVKDKLAKAVGAKYKERRSDEDMYSFFSLMPLYLINHEWDLGVIEQDNDNDILYSIYNKNGLF